VFWFATISERRICEQQTVKPLMAVSQETRWTIYLMVFAVRKPQLPSFFLVFLTFEGRAMAGKFLKHGAIVDLVKSEHRTNAIRKRRRLTAHPITVTVCGCPNPNCGGWHTIRTERTIPTTAECETALAQDNVRRKRNKKTKKSKKTK
jgi:hypothetical protein